MGRKTLKQPHFGERLKKRPWGGGGGGRFTTIALPFSHTNYRELASNLKLCKQKSKNSNTKVETNLQQRHYKYDLGGNYIYTKN